MNTLQATYLSCIKSEKRIFQNLHFQVSSGDLLFLKGANGSGKSTLLRMIGGFTKPSEGSITSNFEIQGNMHYFNDQDLIHPHLTPFEHLTYWSNLLHWSSFSKPQTTSFHRENALYGLEWMQIHHLQNQPCRSLSLGQRKRVALSRLLLKEKILWILDEPIIGLDMSSIGILERMIDIHLQRGGILFLSSHSNMKLNHAVSIHL